MNYKIQLLSFIVSFVYGLVLGCSKTFYFTFIEKKNTVIQIIASFIYALIMAFIYIYISYKINNGVIHLYFLIVVFLGYFLMNYLFKYVKRYVNYVVKIVFRKK